MYECVTHAYASFLWMVEDVSRFVMAYEVFLIGSCSFAEYAIKTNWYKIGL